MSKVKYAEQKQFTKTAEYVYSHYILELTHDIGLEDLMRPDFWKNVASKLKRLSIVTCIGGKDRLDVDLRVMDSGPGYCMMKVIRTAPQQNEIVETLESDRHVGFLPGRGWCVLGKDGGLLMEGLSNREEASERLEEMEAA